MLFHYLLHNANDQNSRRLCRLCPLVDWKHLGSQLGHLDVQTDMCTMVPFRARLWPQVSPPLPAKPSRECCQNQWKSRHFEILASGTAATSISCPGAIGRRRGPRLVGSRPHPSPEADKQNPEAAAARQAGSPRGPGKQQAENPEAAARQAGSPRGPGKQQAVSHQPPRATSKFEPRGPASSADRGDKPTQRQAQTRKFEFQDFHYVSANAFKPQGVLS